MGGDNFKSAPCIVSAKWNDGPEFASHISLHSIMSPGTRVPRNRILILEFGREQYNDDGDGDKKRK